MNIHLAICGPGLSGKNVVSKWLAENLGLRYHMSTSEAAAEVVYDKLKDKYGYSSCDECWNDRRMHRVEWGEIIADHNKPDGIQLYRTMLADHDILDGIRRGAELIKCQELGLIDLSIWVQRDVVGDPSLDYGPEVCDISVDNSGSLEDFYRKLARLGRWLPIVFDT